MIGIESFHFINNDCRGIKRWKVQILWITLKNYGVQRGNFNFMHLKRFLLITSYWSKFHMSNIVIPVHTLPRHWKSRGYVRTIGINTALVHFSILLRDHGWNTFLLLYRHFSTIPSCWYSTCVFVWDHSSVIIVEIQGTRYQGRFDRCCIGAAFLRQWALNLITA